MANADENVKRLAVLTSGGDAPGMNAAIRAVVRAGLYYQYEVYGVYNGYTGLMEDDLTPLNARSVSDIIGRGGTILKTSRSKEFETDEGREKALNVLKARGIDNLVVIGGDGSFRGALDLARQSAGKLNVIGIPGTIDNDIGCTDYTIGFDTALNTVRDCVDKIKDTAYSHERCSIIEVMGRHAGFIALNCAIAGGAEGCLMPECPIDIDADIVEPIKACRARGKKLYLIVVAEGAYSSYKLADEIEEKLGLKPTVSVLGYVQRGGSPTVRDRLTASLMGVRAVELIRTGERGRILATKGEDIVSYDIEEALKMTKTIDRGAVLANEILCL